ncbi:UDP-N-acetylmuramoyl-tripeptide--D-alanyl-D-alanine ligase [Anaerostipes sp.]|uniref:UDP-N-acetylmuramoyl-tripeptide--D-alanyl-D- alanine ligase n=1 Tax=Anaerostipes sp. TaxID=1872530 RepID=UPI0025C26245|nr:UDP-N-acetylmuramoyl-tripeptide--D-alanyl-D-alanine ligase [Anaerostipes sp.]MBS7007074.1 UDP-N-acetylmuramoyl-tripeptide--D-alanyl-D-alanine ligase [Anaerostipes sp.]
MEHMTIQDILTATGGTLLCGDPSMPIERISTDSRAVGPHTLFVPIIGERVNAHKFIDSALKDGGAALTQEHDRAEGPHPFIRVPDTLKAMQQITAYYRNKMKLPIIGVTGSVGKTTTREMIAHVLKGKYRVFETIGNQNSQVGVPLTLDRLTSEDEIGVLEMGMSEPGQITILGEMIHPNAAVVTNVGVSHIKQMGSRDNICREKLDIQNGLPKNGVIYLNGDNDMIRKHIDYVTHPYEFFGFAKDCTYRADQAEEIGGQTHFTFVYGETREPVVLNALGDHNVSNALAAIALGLAYDVPMDVIKKQLSTFSGQRQNIIKQNGYTIIDDAYNASPDSMKAGLKILSDYQDSGRKIAVLSDMLELGPDSPRYHKEVGEYLGSVKVTDLYITGTLSKEYAEAALRGNPSLRTRWFASNEELISFLKEFLKEHDTVLVKGSNGMKLYEIAKALE